MDILKCPRCQGEMAPGHLVDYAGTRFKPDNLPFFAALTGQVSIEAFMCQSCGQIELRGDVGKLNKVLDK